MLVIGYNIFIWNGEVVGFNITIEATIIVDDGIGLVIYMNQIKHIDTICIFIHLHPF